MLEESNSKAKQQFVMALVAAAALVYVGRLGADRLVETLAPVPTSSVTQAAQQPASVDEDDERMAAEARRERVRKEQALIEEDRLRREAKKAAALQAFEESARVAREEQAHKEEVWRRFYRVPKRCDNPPDQQAMVECANQFIRAQQRFEQLYADGKLGTAAAR